MDIESIYKELAKFIDPDRILKNEPMSKHTSFKIGGNADIYLKAESVEEIKQVLKIVKEKNIPLYVVGNGSDLLVKDNGIRGIVLKPDIKTMELKKTGDKINITVGAGVPLPRLAIEMGKKGYSGLEFASGIPGTIGGAIRMNAGAYGSEMKDIVISSTYMDSEGNTKVISNKEHEFGYRTSMFVKNKYIVLNTNIELTKGNKEEIEEIMCEKLKKRKATQPLDLPNAGSTFKRQIGIITSALIDEAGLKGFSIGGAEVSKKHAGFIVNTGNATAKDVIDLINYVQEKIYEKFNVKIEPEIEIIGE